MNLKRYVWGTAALMPAQGNLFSGSYGPYETAVDEVLLSWQKAEYAGTYLYADKITQNDSYYNMWGQYYKGIRKCNTIFTRIDECKDLKGLDRREIMGLTHFMRASFYFYLLEAAADFAHFTGSYCWAIMFRPSEVVQSA